MKLIHRSITTSDINKLAELHKKYYPEFEATDFINDCFSSFVVVDENDEIILGGGLQNIAEAILVTDKSKNTHQVGDALLMALKFSKAACLMRRIEWLHAFTKDDDYKRHLTYYGFEERESKALSLWVPNGK